MSDAAANPESSRQARWPGAGFSTRRCCPRRGAGRRAGRRPGQRSRRPMIRRRSSAAPCGPTANARAFEEAVKEKGPPSMPDEWGGNFTPLDDTVGNHHAVGAPLRGLSWRRSRHRSPPAPPADPRDGRSPLDAHDRRAQAIALDVAHPLPGVRWQHAVGVARAHGGRSPVHARPDELQRVDRSGALAAAARGRRAQGRRLDRRRGRGRHRQRA